MTAAEKQLRTALEEILAMAQAHPAFLPEAFAARDWTVIVAEGGDSADWTGVAIIASDALERKNKSP